MRVEVVTGDFPTRWEMEVTDNEHEDVYAQEVKVMIFCEVDVFT